jgi:hypothetical protein
MDVNQTFENQAAEIANTPTLGTAVAATDVGVAHDAQGQSIEQQLAEIMQTTPYGTPVDPGQAAQDAAQATVDAQAMAAAISMESGFGTSAGQPDLQAEAVAATGEDPTAGNVDHMGELTEQGLANVAQDIGQNPVAQGGFSPGAMWGANSEVAQNNTESGRSSGITPGMIAALNAQDAQGYAINNPNPSEASLQASLVFAELNPTVTNAIIGAMGLMPGTIGFASFLVGLITDKGLLNIPAVRAIPGIQTLTDIVDIPQSLARALTDPFTEPLGRALTAGGELIGDLLSQGEQAIIDALEGIIDFDVDFDEPDGFADGDEIFGGEPEIEFVPPVATGASADAEPAPPARTFAEVDEETRNRILANILSGLRRTGRPTEGVTAFGPLFGGAQPIPILGPIVGAPRPSPAPQPGAAAPSLLTQYQQGYYVETGGGYYRSVGPPGTSSIGQVWKRDELPAGAVIAPKGTKSSDVWGTTPGQGFIKQSPYAGTLT